MLSWNGDFWAGLHLGAWHADAAIGVAATGLSLALLAALLTWRRGARQGLRGWPAWQRLLTLVTLMLTLDLVLVGAYTRLSDSGLGCPDWPGCYGQLSPWQAHPDIALAQRLMPDGPVTHVKAWIEMLHRYLATALGVLIVALAALAWWARSRGGLSWRWPMWTVVWVVAQGMFGAWTVTLRLQPIVVSLHLLGAMTGVALLSAQVRSLEQPDPGRGLSTADWQAWARSATRRWGMALLALLLLQMASGAWVSTNYAVLACDEFPLCQGQWWPATDFDHAFALLRPLGADGQGGYLSLAGLTAIHLTHRCLALLVLAAAGLYCRALWRWRARANALPPWRGWCQLCLGLMALQAASGLGNVLLGWPLVTALVHTLTAALWVAGLVQLLVVPRAALAAPPERVRASAATLAANA